MIAHTIIIRNVAMGNLNQPTRGCHEDPSCCAAIGATTATTAANKASRAAPSTTANASEPRQQDGREGWRGIPRQSGAQRLHLVWPDDEARRYHNEENERKQCEDAVKRESSGGVRQLVPSPLATERACKAAPFRFYASRDHASTGSVSSSKRSGRRSLVRRRRLDLCVH